MLHHDEVRKEIIRGIPGYVQTTMDDSRMPISLHYQNHVLIDSRDVPIDKTIQQVRNAVMDDLADDDPEHDTFCSWEGVLTKHDFDERARHYETYVAHPSAKDKARADKLRAYGKAWDVPTPGRPPYAGKQGG